VTIVDEAHTNSADDGYVPAPMLSRPEDGHKGTFGTVFIIGGSHSGSNVMLGAPALAATAALRGGCGLVKVAVPDTIVKGVLSISPCATGVALPTDSDGVVRASEAAEIIDETVNAGVTCLAIGPGWGIGSAQEQILTRLISIDELPIVIDADGLNVLSHIRDFMMDICAPVILTPHPGEFRRLADTIGIKVDISTAKSRHAACEQMAQRLGCVVILKGAGTVVSNGLDTWVCDINNAALATAGSGDVLTGLVASFVSQFWKPHMGKVTPQMCGGLSLLDCAIHAVQIHANSGDAWSVLHGDAGMLASDLLELIPDRIREIRGTKCQ